MGLRADCVLTVYYAPFALTTEQIAYNVTCYVPEVEAELVKLEGKEWMRRDGELWYLTKKGRDKADDLSMITPDWHFRPQKSLK